VGGANGRPVPHGAGVIELEEEVPGTPADVWAAVATGPGITAWFVPCTVDGRLGGTVTQDFGGGVVGTGKVTRWEPPAAFAYGSAADEPRPGDLAFEFAVAESGERTCVVRLVVTGPATGAMAAGWAVFLVNLRLHLTHFAGEECHSVMATGTAPWDALTGGLGLPAAPSEGDWVAAHAEGGPHFGGRVVHAGPHGYALRTDLPAPGIVLVGALGSVVSLRGYFRGPTGIDAATAGRTAWTSWMAGLAQTSVEKFSQ
jgi:uncharacterized protein YndB with AHSA1/START domain